MKFRAWDNKSKQWLLGYEYPNLGGFSLDGECILMGEWANVVTSFMFEHEGKKYNDLKIMYSSFLLDKNGKEIYEGDILEYKNELGKCNIHKVYRKKGGLVINSHNDDFYRKENTPFYEACADNQTSQYIEQCEVIGNIYQNPELLTK